MKRGQRAMHVVMIAGFACALALSGAACGGGNDGTGSSGDPTSEGDGGDQSGGGGGSQGGGGAVTTDLNTLMSAAVRLSACTGVHVGEAMGRMLFGAVSWSHPVLDLYADRAGCLVGAMDCAAIWACEQIDVTTTCDVADFTRSCDGDDGIMDCQPIDGCGASAIGWVRRTPCEETNQGLVGDNDLCAELAPGAPYCVSGTCDTEGAESCDGDILTSCVSGYAMQVDCGVLDWTCGEEEDEEISGVANARATDEPAAEETPAALDC
ncbi:MAG: hypothetical protein QF464_22915, partial [Myxococcota bacterium]|nr:hypothetical protein [Myxococcota bacterium]